MNSVKPVSSVGKQRIGSLRRKTVLFSVLALVLVGALAAAATKSTDGYVLLNHTGYGFIG